MIKMSIIYIYILILSIYYINPFVGLLTGCQQAYTGHTRPFKIKNTILTRIQAC